MYWFSFSAQVWAWLMRFHHVVKSKQDQNGGNSRVAMSADGTVVEL